MDKREIPSVEALETELNRVRYQKRYGKVLRSTLYTLITVAAVAILVATLWLPVLRITGGSMTPTLQDGELVVTAKSRKLEDGQVIAFYYNNNVLVKRLIAGPGDWVNIDEEGHIYVNGEELNEPYVDELAFGYCDIQLPYQVPDERYFVVGDHRSVSLDSRSSSVGCVASEQIVGRIVFRVWPIKNIGPIAQAG